MLSQLLTPDEKGSSYPFLLKEPLRGEEAMRASEACLHAAIMYGVTLVASIGCCVVGRNQEKRIGIAESGFGG